MRNNHKIIHLPVINSLRGIAAIMIMIHHITVYFLPQISNDTQAITPFFRKSYLWVDFFFILSGFIACHVYKDVFNKKVSFKNYTRFIISRFARLYPLHLVVLLLFVVLELVYLYFYHAEGLAIKYNNIPIPFDSDKSEKGLLLGIMMLNALSRWSTWNGPSWAMSAIWITAFVLPFFIKISFYIKRIWHVVFTLGCYITIWMVLKKEGTLDIMAAGGMIRCVAETVIGVGCYSLFSAMPANRYLRSNYILALCILLVFVSMLLPINHVVTVAIFFPLIFVAANQQAYDSVFSNHYLLLLGDLSFAIYIIHWLPLEILDKIAILTTGSKFNSMESPFVIAMIVIPVTISIIFISYYAQKHVETPLRYFVKSKLGITF